MYAVYDIVPTVSYSFPFHLNTCALDRTSCCIGNKTYFVYYELAYT